MMHKGVLMVLSGFSGAGKGTLVKYLMEKYDNFALSISMTTRQPRAGEKDGVEYFFTDREHFLKTVEENGLIEYAEYCGNFYGTPRKYVEEQLTAGKDVILEIEIQGALKIREKFPECLLIFVTPPNAEELERRLTERGTETPEVIKSRLARAYEESQGMDAYDYIAINDNLARCAEEITEIVEAARKQPVRMAEFIKEIREELKEFSKGEE